MSATSVGFSLGSNLGDRLGHVETALTQLFAHADIRFAACSSFYETPPWGVAEQPAFVNVCAAGETSLEARALLEWVKVIEADLGREKTTRWGPRLIDIDILYFGADEIVEPDLAIPHRELFNRAFVLVPLAEIRPDLVLADRRIGDAAADFDTAMPIIAQPWRPG